MVTAKKPKPAEPTLTHETPAAWDLWLKANHLKSSGVLLQLAKGKESQMNYAQALDVALAWGWIDSQKQALDGTHWLQRFTPRTAKSPWSKINRVKAEALIASGKMQPTGLAEVTKAKTDGRWEAAYDGARSAEPPEDLVAALAKKPKAKAFFASLSGANRYAILFRVQQPAAKPETRAARISKFVEMCERGETLHPETRKKKP